MEGVHEYCEKHDRCIDTYACQSLAADARIPGDQIEPMTNTFLAQAAATNNQGFRECINDKFIGKDNGQKTELWSLLHQAMIIAVAKNLVDDDVTFSIVANDFINKPAATANWLAVAKSQSKVFLFLPLGDFHLCFDSLFQLFQKKRQFNFSSYRS